MRILIVSFFDDNFGDMLIRQCFERLLRTALKNLNAPDDCLIAHAHIKDAGEDDIKGSDLVFFAGGAMLGVNNLGTFENIDHITAIADGLGVPVVFSSIGINNYHADENTAAAMNAILRRKCVKAMSTREDPAVFAPFTEGCIFEPVQVCDPAVWTSCVYSELIADARSKKPSDKKTIGINFVRGGLFKANGRGWTLNDEEEYINKLRLALTEAGYECRFFTNGSVLDNNSLTHFAETYSIDRAQVVYPDCTREVIAAIAGCDAAVNIRMHASIICYSLCVPSLNLIWNEKIEHFYTAIGCPDRAIDPVTVEPRIIAQQAAQLIDESYQPDSEYMMSLYRFLCDAVSDICGLKKAEPYSYEQVRGEMISMPNLDSDDVDDYRAKLRRARHCYTKLFEKDMESNQKLRDSIKQKNAEIKELKKELKSLRSQLDYIYNKPVVKLYKKLRGSDK